MGGYVAFLLAMKGTAIYNLAAAILLICMFILFHKARQGIYLPERFLLVPYLVFAGGLCLAAVLQGELHSVAETLHYLYLTLPLFIMYAGSRCFGRREVVYKAFVIAAAVTAAACLSVGFSSETWFEGRFSPESHPNVTVQLLVLPIPFMVAALYKLRKSWFWSLINVSSLLLIMYAAYLTRSRGGMAGLLAGLLVLGVLAWPVLKSRWTYKKTAVVSLVLASLMTVMAMYVAVNVFTRVHGDQGRIYLIHTAVHMFEDHPLYGIGIDNWNREYPSYLHPDSKEPNLPHAHNDILNLLATTGILGAGGYVFFSIMTWFYLVKRLKEQPKEAMLWAMIWMFVSLQVHGFVDIGIQYNQTARMFFGMLGLTVAMADESEENVSA